MYIPVKKLTLFLMIVQSTELVMLLKIGFG